MRSEGGRGGRRPSPQLRNAPASVPRSLETLRLEPRFPNPASGILCPDTRNPGSGRQAAGDRPRVAGCGSRDSGALQLRMTPSSPVPRPANAGDDVGPLAGGGFLDGARWTADAGAEDPPVRAPETETRPRGLRCHGWDVGAKGGTRTPTGRSPQDPESCASTNSATFARGAERSVGSAVSTVNPRRRSPASVSASVPTPELAHSGSASTLRGPQRRWVLHPWPGVTGCETLAGRTESRRSGRPRRTRTRSRTRTRGRGGVDCER